MRPGMKMMMLDRARRGNDPGMQDRSGGMENSRNRRFEYEETRNAFEPENRNRRRYRDGRFAPRNDGGSMEMEDRYNGPENRYDGPESRHNGPRYAYGGYRMNEDGDRMVGFDGGSNAYDNGSMRMHGGESKHSKHQMGHGESKEQERKHLDQETAKEWVEDMGECFSMEETMEALKKRKCKCEPLEFWVIVNAMKSDYPKLAAKYGVDHIDFYADMAVEWLEDRDAKPGKAMNYYNYVVKHG